MATSSVIEFTQHLRLRECQLRGCVYLRFKKDEAQDTVSMLKSNKGLCTQLAGKDPSSSGICDYESNIGQGNDERRLVMKNQSRSPVQPILPITEVCTKSPGH